MLSILFSIGLLLAPSVIAAEPDEDTLYFKIKNLVELEILKQNAEVQIERFAAGIFYDKELVTIVKEGDEELSKQMEIKIPFVDMSLTKDISAMCGKNSSDQEEQNAYITCLAAQEILKSIVDKNSWHRTLGRDLQAITSG
ncbi:hypothetical protein HOK40_02060, partial [Candidatus Peregrinibacteria bacterium]|nr:hypothetical protein [Candidatus Peregrinibacteria bacterium]